MNSYGNDDSFEEDISDGGPGENGKPYKVDTETMDKKIKKRIERGWQNNAFNEYVSDLISVHR